MKTLRLVSARLHTVTQVALSLGILLSLSVLVRAQANFSEGFDNTQATVFPDHGPQNLLSNGWEFDFNSQQSSQLRKFQYRQAMTSFQPTMAPFGGSDYLVAVSSEGYRNALWAVLPSVPGQAAGDTVALSINRYSGFSPLFEIRYSPTGGTDIGSAHDATGDFSTVLASVAGVASGWNQVTGVVPGQGRIALRVYDNVGGSGNVSIGLDELTVGPPPVCTTCLPLPAAGETVHWTPAFSPVLFDASQTIVAGGTVVVDPGVQVFLQPGGRLIVEGDIEFSANSSLTFDSGGTAPVFQVRPGGEARFLGSSAAPIPIAGSSFNQALFELYGPANLRFDFVDFVGFIEGDWTFAGDGSPTIHASNSNFTSSGGPFFEGIELKAGTLVLEDCVFDAVPVRTEEVHHTLRNLTFQNEAILDTSRRNLGQPLLIDTITATGNANGSPLRLGGNDHHFGPNNSIFGNLYPVDLDGGLTETSTLPMSGNVENVIALTGLGGAKVTVPNLGMPYHVLNSVASQDGTVHPGVLFQIAPGAAMGPTGGGGTLYELDLRGTPADPIRFERLIPGMPWEGLSWVQDGFRANVDWVVVDGAETGVLADGCRVTFQNALFRNCNTGGFGVRMGVPIFRSCIFRNNGTALLTSAGVAGTGGTGSGEFDADGSTNPNSFDSNTIGANDRSPQAFSSAKNNWWGTPAGPQNPTNPGGTGNEILGSVDFLPVRTTAPNPNDWAPSVRILGMNEFATPGERTILRWEASDNLPIDHFRLEFSDHHGCFPYSTFLDQIPGDQRALALEIPPLPSPGNCTENAAFRLVAVDAGGQEGFDVWDYFREQAPLSGPPLLILPSVLRPGDVFPGANPGADTLLAYDDSELTSPQIQGSATWVSVPPVSSDLVRFALSDFGGLIALTPYLEVRPDPALTGDFPPQVTLLTPTAGQSFFFGSGIPLSWTASDDQALRSFEIQASYNGGRRWHVIEKDLPANSTSYLFELPTSTFGIADFRVRVLARDWSFQVSSDGTDRALSLLPSSPARYMSFGSGCAGSGGPAPLLAAAPGSLPTLGATFEARITSPQPFLASWMLIGFGQTSIPLAPIGAPGCTLLVQPPVVSFALDQSATWRIRLPISSGIVGLSFFNQGVLLAPGANPIGLTFTNGGVGVIG